MGSERFIETRTRKLIKAVRSRNDICEEGTSVEAVSVLLETDLEARRIKRQESGRKGGISKSVEWLKRPPLDHMKLVKAAITRLKSGTPQYRVVSQLRKCHPYSDYSAKHIRTILLNNNVIKKRT